MIHRIVALVCALLVVTFAPQPAGAQPVPGPAYRISPGDDLEIMVWGDERLQRVVRVLPDGSFGFPLIGQVMAAGLKHAIVHVQMTPMERRMMERRMMRRHMEHRMMRREMRHRMMRREMRRDMRGM